MDPVLAVILLFYLALTSYLIYSHRNMVDRMFNDPYEEYYHPYYMQLDPPNPCWKPVFDEEGNLVDIHYGFKEKKKEDHR